MIASELRLAEPNSVKTNPDFAESPSVVQELQAWRLASESASRCNRNLLQYAAGLAALLGISAGGGGMIAVANSLQTRAGGSELSNMDALIGSLVAITIIVCIVLLLMLAVTFRHRQAAEHDSDAHLARLIALAPRWFEPKV